MVPGALLLCSCVRRPLPGENPRGGNLPKGGEYPQEAGPAWSREKSRCVQLGFFGLEVFVLIFLRFSFCKLFAQSLFVTLFVCNIVFLWALRYVQGIFGLNCDAPRPTTNAQIFELLVEFSGWRKPSSTSINSAKNSKNMGGGVV